MLFYAHNIKGANYNAIGGCLIAKTPSRNHTFPLLVKNTLFYYQLSTTKLLCCYTSDTLCKINQTDYILNKNILCKQVESDILGKTALTYSKVSQDYKGQ